MALAADVVVAETRDIGALGSIPPVHVITPGALVDYLFVEAQ